MDLISPDNLAQVLAVLSDPFVYAMLILGSMLGLVFGATPGLTAPAAIALALPITYGMGLNPSLALLLGIYVSGYFSGSIPAILINTPGTPGNAATAIEGYPMAQKGRAGEALTTAVISSFIGVLISVICLLTLAPLMARVALSFQSAEYFSLALLGLMCVAGISTGSMIKGLAAALFGVLVSTIGIDQTSGVPRFTLGVSNLLGGVPIITALIGLFALSEMLIQSRRNFTASTAIEVTSASSVMHVLREHAKNKWLVFKSSMIGTLIGILPGTGPAIASWIAYGDALRGRKPGDQFGKGEIKGLMACETSNNAVIGGAMVPLLTLGIPGDPVTAILIGALMIQGIEPGPFFMRDHGGLFLAIVAMLLMSNIAMVAAGLSIRRLAAKILAVPRHIIVPVVVAVAATATYAISYSPFEVMLVGVFGVIGYLMMRYGFPVAAAVIGIVLGPILETNFRNALVANNMDFTVFVTRPVSAGLLLATVLLLYFWTRQEKRQAAFARSVAEGK